MQKTQLFHLNRVHQMYEYIVGVDEAKSIPTIVYLEPTTLCNLKCPACPTGEGLTTLRESSDFEVIRSYADSLEDYVLQWYLFNWGEPLLNKQSRQIIEYLSSKSFYVKLSSNFSVPLKDELIEALAQASNFEIRIDLDGSTADEHQSYRRGSKFELVIDNSRRLSQAIKRSSSGSPAVIVGTLDFNLKESSKTAIQEFAEELGFSHKIYSSPFQKDQSPPIDLTHYLPTFGCSWLQSVLAVSPSGNSIAPCCGVWDPRYFDACTSGETLPDAAVKTWQSVDKYQERRNQSNQRRLWSRDNFEEWMQLNARQEKGMLLQQTSLTGDICENCTMGGAYQQQLGRILEGGMSSVDVLTGGNQTIRKAHLDLINRQDSSSILEKSSKMLRHLNKSLPKGLAPRTSASYSTLLEFIMNQEGPLL